LWGRCGPVSHLSGFGILGLSDDDIADLLVEGVITTEADVPGAL